MARPFSSLIRALPLLALLAACQRLPAPEQSGELVVAIRKDPLAYHMENDEISGLEHDLVEAFAEASGFKVRYVVASDQGELRRLLKEGQVHFAASVSLDDDKTLLTTSPLLESEQVLVGHGDDLALEADPVELDGHQIAVMFATPQLSALQAMAGQPPKFTVQIRTGVSELNLLQDVAERRTDFAATDRLHYRLALQFLPELELGMTLPGTLRYGWAFLPKDKPLADRAEEFLTSARKSGLMARIRDRYLGNIERIKPQGIGNLLNDIQTRLPHFRKHFQDAQEITGIDWRLLAAVAYQESKWDPLATSPTGVRGMMMLTEDTADRLRVTNRLDPRQSILAGARYLADLRDDLPGNAQEPDRTWLALAAYNLGMGHLNGARSIAAGMKRDPNAWFEMKSVLPLMSRPEYYSRLKSGRARGGEAVIMVENIRTYQGILNRLESPWQPAYHLAKPAARQPQMLEKKKPPKLGGLSLP